MPALEIQPDARGRLSETPLPHLLLALHTRRFDGELILKGERAEKRFVFAGGSPVLAESNLASETLGMQLVDQGQITRTDYDRACVEMKRRDSREGVALLALKLITPKDLFQALKDQVRRRLVEAFGWPDGEFRLDPTVDPGDEVQPFRVDPLHLVQAGLEAHWDINRMLADLTPRLGLYPQGTKRVTRFVARLADDEGERAELANIDGTKTLTDRVGVVMHSARSLARLWILDAMGALMYLDEAFDPMAADTGDDFEFDIEVSDAANSSSAAGAGHRSPRARQPEDSSQPSAARSEAIREEILTRHTLLGEDKDDVTHYCILEIDPTSSAAAIKKAYFNAAKRYHPDALGRLGLDEIKETAADVFARIAEAFEVLGDERKRKTYDERLASGGEEFDAEALAQAEKLFLKGEVLLKMGDFKGAEGFLRSCVELWPEESAYQAAFGWSLFKKAPSEPEEALHHLKYAVTLGPDNANAQDWLDMVLRARA